MDGENRPYEIGEGGEGGRRLIESDVKRWRETAAKANLQFE